MSATEDPRARHEAHAGLTPAELEAETAEALPERQAMSTVSVSSIDAATGTAEAVSDGMTDTVSAKAEAPAKEPSEDRANNAQQRGHDEPARITARHQKLGHDPDDETEQNPTEYAQHANPPLDAVCRGCNTAAT